MCFHIVKDLLSYSIRPYMIIITIICLMVSKYKLVLFKSSIFFKGVQLTP